jgi:hypothetical protein
MKFLAAALLATLSVAAQTPSAHLSPDGRLVYSATSSGDHIADFSYAGYMAGGIALPVVPVAQTLRPSGNDDTDSIQSALDHTAARAAQEHKTLAVVLATGTFHLSHAVNIAASNIVLRGAGTGKTILVLTGTPHLAIHIGSVSAPSSNNDAAKPTPSETAPAIVTTLAPGLYVPSGTQTIHVANATGFAAGDTIEINHPITPEYTAFMGMDHLVRSGLAEHWVGSHISIERRIASIDGNILTLDVPLTDNYDLKFGGGVSTRVQKITPRHRLSQVGVESLSITCPALKINLTDPHFDGIQIIGTEDAWLRDLHLEETTNNVSIESTARRITIDHVDIVQHIPIQSPAKNFAFSIAGTQTLIMRSSAAGDKVFFVASQAREQGPNVVLYSEFHGDHSIEPHQRWGTGLLVDNVNVHGGAINFINRGIMGTGHGWTMGWGIVWNSTANSISVQSPPGAVNWVIGSSGQRVRKPMPVDGDNKITSADLPEGTFESPGKRVKPDSLYLQQLSDRLGPQALKNIGY